MEARGRFISPLWRGGGGDGGRGEARGTAGLKSLS